MEATHLVISIEGALAIAAAIIGGAFGIYRASAIAHAEIRATLAAHTEKFNTINERFNALDQRHDATDERLNRMQAQITRVEDKVDRTE